ncbi:metal-dependent transcriptional regulator [Agrococcus sp. SL85]|uniref:metal-dependent transcriptional regulator n=1 Tax=Agrococcus sp. SL85 TaxID=2995141 RepID=UPI00226CC3B4|nr:metal-dependent transcriptional regulator [Agrococcus sp. SL85]WAC65536.1 metal-dependent transcriptional regulator [Agrococcus sp. SL85]
MIPSTAAEDYVKAIYGHTEWQPEPITPSQLATALGLANSTVTEMVKKLAAAGLVRHRPYGAIELTPEGRALALRQTRRHRVVETWLVERHGYDWDEVHDEAEVLEHAMSDRLLDSIAASLGDPSRDPHGDPIPAADGSVVRPEAVLLAEAPPGHRGAVVRISDADPAMLRFLAESGIALDAGVEVVGHKPYSGSIEVRVEGSDVALGPDVARSVWLAA